MENTPTGKIPRIATRETNVRPERRLARRDRPGASEVTWGVLLVLAGLAARR
ncbi:hypothetical protein [Candidatus Halobonum tyrrellensis]|uniref:hypothetical protein n=1 Tax=Candidatus Halobonum tyrrellensis TaxID=1431545 RepID=UPI00137905B9|nr:hypothetical protein [Candidatus Halobonum tyrrellensis]